MTKKTLERGGTLISLVNLQNTQGKGEMYEGSFI
ncbi:hypothetical protein Mpal_1410 [Methanosphaerula palustris E1-9c]|uniref:Uncharacterized protein n=1 Tax=Methanosphaerula palustris (strain ATCC BAA-1556 / DSM 19958 / E1-9c) TaxID=521011 RepID=B8GHZ9_METPE|nr:hypothetical protein Mpal_1410 [Methanosphaerula palustris E1-9c]